MFVCFPIYGFFTQTYDQPFAARFDGGKLTFDSFKLQQRVCSECAKEIIERLSSTELNGQDLRGETALIKAIKTKRHEIAQILIAKNVDVNIQDNKGRTALHWAVDNPVPEVYYDMLIQHGATHINITDKNGRTPFEYLLENKMTSYLQSKKVWPKEGNSNGNDNSEKREFIRLYQNVVTQLFDIIFPQLQRANHNFDENVNELIGDVINIIETSYPFTKMIQNDGAMMKIQRSLQNFFQQLSSIPLAGILMEGRTPEMNQGVAVRSSSVGGRGPPRVARVLGRALPQYQVGSDLAPREHALDDTRPAMFG